MNCFSPIEKIKWFSLVAFKSFSFFFGFQKSHYDVLAWISLALSCFRFAQLLNLYVSIAHQIWDVFSRYCFKYFLGAPSVSLLLGLQWYTFYTFLNSLTCSCFLSVVQIRLLVLFYVPVHWFCPLSLHFWFWAFPLSFNFDYSVFHV